MSGGGESTTTQQNYSPEEAAERTRLAAEVRSQYEQSKGAIANQGYAGVVPTTPSAATTQGQNIALGAVPQMQNMAQGVAQAQQFGLSDVLNPESNPGLQEYIQSAIRPITESYVDPGGVMSQIRTGANEAGQVGGSRQGVAEGIAAGRYANAIGDTTSKIVNEAYGQGLDTFGKTLTLAPQTIATQTQPADVASAVGSQQEQYQALLNQYQAASRDWDLNKNWDLLQNYANMVYGAGGSQSTATQDTQPSGLQTAGTIGQLALMAAPYFMGSDPRLKENIEEVGVHAETGLTLYEFNYIATPEQRWRGVMADEVLKLYPEAVVERSDGYLAVNYAMLGFDMEKVNA